MKFFDENGNELPIATFMTHYTKDLAGNIGPDGTEVGVFIDPSEIERLTIVLGPESVVDRADHTVTLRP